MSDRPLAGCRVLVTRPVGQAEPLCAAIEAAGGSAVRFPVVQIEPREVDDIRADLASLADPDIVIFVSRNAVDYGAPQLRESGAAFAAVGRATLDALLSLGLTVSIDPGQGYTSEHLLAHDALREVAGKNVLIVRGDDGRALLGNTLRERAAAVAYLPVYRRSPTRPPPGEIDRLLARWAKGGIHCVSVMSVASLEYLVAMLPPAGVEMLRKTPLVAPGERVIQTAGKLLPGIPAMQASGPLPEDIVSALADWRRSGMNQ